MATNEILRRRLQEAITKTASTTGQSEAAIARAIGVPAKNFNNYRKGREPRDRRDLQKIADYFRLSIPYLLGYAEDPSNQTTVSQDLLHQPLTSPAKTEHGSNAKGEVMVDLYRSLLRLADEMASLRQDIRRLNEKVGAMEAESRGPQKGRKARL